MLSRKFLNCQMEQNDYYENTVEPPFCGCQDRVINLRWSPTIDPSTVTVEFFNYYSEMMLYQPARTITSRGSHGVYARTSPDMIAPLSPAILTPNGSQRFRLRFGDYVSNYMPIHANETYYFENGKIFQLYN